MLFSECVIAGKLLNTFVGPLTFIEFVQCLNKVNSDFQSFQWWHIPLSTSFILFRLYSSVYRHTRICVARKIQRIKPQRRQVQMTTILWSDCLTFGSHSLTRLPLFSCWPTRVQYVRVVVKSKWIIYVQCTHTHNIQLEEPQSEGNKINYLMMAV